MEEDEKEKKARPSPCTQNNLFAPSCSSSSSRPFLSPFRAIALRRGENRENEEEEEEEGTVKL